MKTSTTLVLIAAGVPSAASTCAHAQLSTWAFTEARLEYGLDDPTPGWAEYAQAPTIAATPVTDGIQFAGTASGHTVFSFTGSSYVQGATVNPDYVGNRLVLRGTGTVDGPQWNPDTDMFLTDVVLSGFVSGGEVLFVSTQMEYEVFNAANVLINGGGVQAGPIGPSPLPPYEIQPGPYSVAFTHDGMFFRDNETAPASDMRTFTWEYILQFEWRGRSPGDTFTLNMVPGTFGHRTIPSPSGIIVLAALGAPLARLRSRRQ